MLVVLAERLAQILDWFKNVAGYRIVETHWKVLDLSSNHRQIISHFSDSPDNSSPESDSLVAHLRDWISPDEKISFLWLSNLTSGGKEDLLRSLMDVDATDILLVGISYTDAQFLSNNCRSTPYTLPRCRSYRLRKSQSIPATITDHVVQRRTLYFSRHGESEFNVQGRVGGDADLSSRGRLYATKLAEYVNRELTCIPGFRVWTSCMKRTIQTARYIHAPQERLAILNELDTGICDGMTYEEIAERFPEEFALRDNDKFRYRYPEGESYLDLLERVKPVLERLRQEDNLLVVSHQAVIRCLLAALLKKDDNELPYINAPLHTIMRLTFVDGLPKLDLISLSIECVDTHRKKPENCSRSRSTEEALTTVPAHF